MCECVDCKIHYLTARLTLLENVEKFAIATMATLEAIDAKAASDLRARLA